MQGVVKFAKVQLHKKTQEIRVEIHGLIDDAEVTYSDLVAKSRFPPFSQANERQRPNADSILLKHKRNARR